MRAAKIIHPCLIVDASHENSLNGKGKDPTLQEMVLSTTMLGVKQQREEYAILKGWMLESFIMEGKQPEKGPTYDMRGLSITDACVGWEQTNRIIRETADALDTVS
jgi:3-deoxy-7-phosphoheptulonate synthase